MKTELRFEESTRGGRFCLSAVMASPNFELAFKTITLRDEIYQNK